MARVVAAKNSKTEQVASVKPLDTFAPSEKAFLQIAQSDLTPLQIEAQTLVGRSVAVLGITGSGKTNTAAVLIEELLSNAFPLTIVDIEGEYWGLKERFEILVAGRSSNADFQIDVRQAGALARFSVEKGIPVILDLSDFEQGEMFDFLLVYFKSLWEACSNSRQPYQVILEEAHEFIPQGIRTPLKEILTRIALRGRKRGLGIILMSQRSAKVDKDVLTQTSLLFLHRVIHPVDVKVYTDLVPLAPRQVEEMVGALRSGQAIVLYNNEIKIVQIRRRRTFDAGATPDFALATSKLPQLRKIDKAVLAELRKLAASSSKIEEDSEKIRLTRRVAELEEVVSQQEKQIERLETQVSILSLIKLSVEPSLIPSGPDAAEPLAVYATASYRPSQQTMEVTEANVQQVRISELQHYLQLGKSGDFGSGKPVPEALTQPDTITHLDQKPEIDSSLAIPPDPSEQHKLDLFVKRLKKLSKLERSVLQLLAQHEGTSMTVPTIAAWLGLSEATVRNHPPHNLLKMKLISRVRTSVGYSYTSNLADFVKNHFPYSSSGNISTFSIWLR